jgi:hypothetical protein
MRLVIVMMRCDILTTLNRTCSIRTEEPTPCHHPEEQQDLPPRHADSILELECRIMAHTSSQKCPIKGTPSKLK